jgi:hypothetical protein
MAEPRRRWYSILYVQVLLHRGARHRLDARHGEGRPVMERPPEIDRVTA